MTTTSITSSQQAFIDALKAQVGTQFSSQLDGTFQPMSMPSGMYYGIQAGPNNFYNENFLAQVNQEVIIGSNGMMQPGGSTFTDVYRSIMNAIVFEFSSADQKALQADLTDNQSQVQTVINAWEADMGAPISASQMSSAMPPTKLGYIQGVVQSKWGGKVDAIPSSMQDFKNAYSSFQTSAQVANRLTLQSAAAMTELSAIRANLLPSATNGALQTDTSSYALAFGPFPTQNAINNSLNSTDRSLQISFDVNDFESESSQLSIQGETGFSVPIADIVTFGFGGSASYTLDKYASSDTAVKVSMDYQGVTFLSTPVTAGAISEDLSEGWWASDVLAQAIQNPDAHETGYSLQGGQFPIDQTFGDGGTFSRIKTWVISQEPTITIEISAGDTSSIESDFKENASATVKLFGLFDVGWVSQSYQVQSVDSSSVNGSVIIKLAGPDVVSGTTNLQDARAFLIGGVPSYPPTDA